MNIIENFVKCIECDFKGEHYSVRDNGAVYRHKRDGKRKRPLDEVWTFGSSRDKGYRFLNNVRVHRIVAKAFLGDLPKPDYVVDHIDTNRANNRPENLRYCSRLENALCNPITRMKIELKCGSIEAFIENPSILQDSQSEEDSMLSWMRAVTPEEAKASYDNWKLWAEKKKESASNYQRMPISDSIYKKNNDEFYSTMSKYAFKSDKDQLETQQRIKKEFFQREDRWQREKEERAYAKELEKQRMAEEREKMSFTESKTSNCIQEDWRTPTEFLCCPETISDTPLVDYYNKLYVNDMFCRNQYNEQSVVETALSSDNDKIWVISNAPQGVKHWCVSEIYLKNGKFVHKSIITCFELIGAQMYFTEAQGKEWKGKLGVDYYSN